MNARPPAWISVACVVLLLAGAAVGSLPALDLTQASPGGKMKSPNDAGSGGDAGNTPLDALVVAGTSRFYHGNLTTPTTDRDWYRLAGAPTGPAFCAEGKVSTSVPASATLALRPDRSAEISRSVGASSDAHLAVAALAADGLWLGVEPPGGIAATSTSTKGPEHYRFELRMPTPVNLDPDAASNGATVLDRPCFGGALDVDHGDTVDEYLLQTTSARSVTFSFAKDGNVEPALDVVSPSGFTVATLRSGDIRTVALDESGWWTLRVRVDPGEASIAFASAVAKRLAPAHAAEATSDGDYIIGLTTDSDYWCRPSCSTS